jgi:hypothetical protein
MMRLKSANVARLLHVETALDALNASANLRLHSGHGML